MKLPNYERAVVAQAKITDYLLSETPRFITAYPLKKRKEQDDDSGT